MNRVKNDGIVLYKDGKKIIGSSDYKDAAIDALNGYLRESSKHAILMSPLMKNPYINELKKFFLPIEHDLKLSLIPPKRDIDSQFHLGCCHREIVIY